MILKKDIINTLGDIINRLGLGDTIIQVSKCHECTRSVHYMSGYH